MSSAAVKWNAVLILPDMSIQQCCFCYADYRMRFSNRGWCKANDVLCFMKQSPETLTETNSHGVDTYYLFPKAILSVCDISSDHCQGTVTCISLTVCLSDTGWALCGHETPAGEAEQAATDLDTETSASDALLAAHVPKAHTPAESRPATAVASVDGSCMESNGVGQQVGTAASRDQQASCDPVVSLSRTERMALGQKCKRLIDAGRAMWLAEQGFKASVNLVKYMYMWLSRVDRLSLG